MRALRFALTFALALGIAPALRAQVCTVDTSPIRFGVVDLARINHARGRIAISCTAATTVSITITGSAGGSQRAMVGPDGARLYYELFSSLWELTIWGDGQGRGSPVTVTVPAGERVERTVYAVLPAQPGAPPGEYSDQLLVVVDF